MSFLLHYILQFIINKDYKDIQIRYDEKPRIVGQIVGDFMPLEV